MTLIAPQNSAFLDRSSWSAGQSSVRGSAAAEGMAPVRPPAGLGGDASSQGWAPAPPVIIGPPLRGDTAFGATQAGQEPQETDTPDETSARSDKEARPRAGELSPEEDAAVRELRARDREVKAHERAHQSAGAGLTGGASYEYAVGPDGQRYAVAGEVSISVPAGGSPQETIQAMQQVKRAALAPARPSGQDRAVARRAEQTIREAEARLSDERVQKAAAEDESRKDADAASPAAAEAKGADPVYRRAAEAYGQSLMAGGNGRGAANEGARPLSLVA